MSPENRFVGIDGLLALLKNVMQGQANQWSARCPAHEDNRNSLSIALGDDGKILVKCFAGCKTAAVVDALGLKMVQLFPERTRAPHHHGRTTKRSTNGCAGRAKFNIVKTYDYVDEAGTLLFQVCRMDPKDFRQRRPNEGGGWIWSTKGIRRVLYRLPELLKSDKSQVVFIVEGEKDVERLVAAGRLATTNAGGVGKWKSQYAEPLYSQPVVILPDNDEPGRKHAQQIARSLKGKAASTKIVELPGLPDKGDVSDFFDAGGTVEQLDKLVADAPNWDPQTKESEETEPDGTNAGTAQICNAVPGKLEPTPVPMVTILATIKILTGDWPRRVGRVLFVNEHEGAVDWLESSSSMFGWIGSKSSRPANFVTEPDCHTKTEVFEEMRRTATAYDAVEVMPHEPRMAGHYYACMFPEPGNGEALRALVGRFNPATEIDRDLIMALFATPMWGGRGGSRPAVSIVSDDGRGVGKTTLAGFVGHLYRGTIELSTNEDIKVIKERLLSPEGLTKRVAVLDNEKARNFSWAEFESLVTTPTISGKRMYVGEGSRPNNITWIITMNGGSYSTDMAQRSVFVKLNRPEHSGTWEEETREFIDANRQQLVADIIALLRTERFNLEGYSRWGAWEREVLSRLPEPSDAQRVILERQGIADVEIEEAELVEDFFRQQITGLQYDADSDRVFIPSRVACSWLGAALNDKFNTTAASRSLIQKITEGKFKRLQVNRCNSYGRGFVWTGETWNPADGMKADLETRLDFESHRAGF